MQRDGPDLGDRGYEAAHIAAVLADMTANFPAYIDSYGSGSPPLGPHLAERVEGFRREQIKYLDLFDLRALEEYAYDPNAFKADLRRVCPIIHRCLMSPAKVMDAYRRSFNYTAGATLLEVTERIVRYAHRHFRDFDDDGHESSDSVEALNLGGADDMALTAAGVIGGGIRSRFLHMLYPRVFPNRSQNAIWAMYFLTDRKDYGFRDGSEFLMIEPERAQQNYFYPYDLFAFYALQLHKLIRVACDEAGVALDPAYRYVYLDALLDHVADENRDAIQCLLGVDEYDHNIYY